MGHDPDTSDRGGYLYAFWFAIYGIASSIKARLLGRHREP